MARVHAMAIEFIRHSDARFDLHRLTRFIAAYQTVAPLTLGELWAWPSMLKLGLIENLRRLAEEILESRDGRGRGRPLLRALRSRSARGSAAAASRDALERVRGPAAPAHARARPAGRRAADRSSSAGSQARARASTRRSAPSTSGRPWATPRSGTRSPSLRLVSTHRLEPHGRAGEPDGAGAAARPGGRLRPDGLREPRPLPPGGRGAGRAHRRGPGARGAARGRERAPVGREAPAGRRRARTSATT